MSEASSRKLPLEPLADELVRLSPARGHLLGAIPTDDASRPPGGGHGLERLRSAGLAAALRHPDERTRGLLCAVLFGDTSYLAPGVTDLFTRTGTRHMLALSGLHVGILGVLVALPLARAVAAAARLALAVMGVHRRLSPAVPLTALALLFVPLAGHGAPAARAAFALALGALGPRLRLDGSRVGRRPGGLNLLGVALIVEVSLDPLAPLRPGVQLSYLATAALILVAPRAGRRMLAWAPGGPSIATTWRSGRERWPLGRVVALRLKQALLLAVSTSLVASAATLPIVWTCFGEWSPVGVVATPLALPFLVVLVAGGWLWLVAPAVVGDAVIGWATSGLLGLLTVLDCVPASPLPLPQRPVLAVALTGYLALRGAAAEEGPSGRRHLRLAALLGGLLIFPWPIDRRGLDGREIRALPRSLEVHVLDVGAGTAIVARAPGSPTWLFDAGSRDRVGVARSAVAPLLRAMDVGRLRVALSHAHADHARGLPWIAERWPPEVWVGPLVTRQGAGGPGRASVFGAHHLPLEPGVSRVSAPGDPLQVLALRAAAFDRNEGSAVLDLRWVPEGTARPAARIVLMGDAEGQGLARLLEGGAGGAWLDRGPIDALLLPHHGSESRLLGPLLDHLQPAEVWSSAHAPPAARSELERRGLRVRSTATDGFFRWPPGDGSVP